MRRASGGSAERGAAFLLAVLVAAIVVPIAIEVAFVSRIEGSISNRYARRVERRLLARSAIEAARAILERDPATVDHPLEPWARIPEVDVGGYRVSLLLEDEGRRFPANDVVRPDGTLSLSRKAALARVLEAAGLGAAPADVMADWIDPDDAPLPNGAEAAVYGALTPPRRPANRPFLSPEEFGRLAGFNEAATRRVREVATPWGSTVNVNTASPEVLAALGLDRAALDRLILRRETTPIRSWDEFLAATGAEEKTLVDVESLVGYASSHFRATVRVGLPGEGDAEAFEIQAVVDRRGDGAVVFWREG